MLGELTPSPYDSSIHLLVTKSGTMLGAGKQWREVDMVTAFQGLHSGGADGCQSDSHVLLNKTAQSESRRWWYVMPT